MNNCSQKCVLCRQITTYSGKDVDGCTSPVSFIQPFENNYTQGHEKIKCKFPQRKNSEKLYYARLIKSVGFNT